MFGHAFTLYYKSKSSSLLQIKHNHLYIKFIKFQLIKKKTGLTLLQLMINSIFLNKSYENNGFLSQITLKAIVLNFLLQKITELPNVQENLWSKQLITQAQKIYKLIQLKFSQQNYQMSNKKEDKKKGGKKDKEKDKEKERMAEEEKKKQQQRLQAQARIGVLEKSGILDAYQYFLRAICKNGLPEANIFQFAAQQILKYQKKMKLKEVKKEQLGKSPDRETQGSIQKLEKHQKAQKHQKADKSQKQKPKPAVLPFKGQAKEEALKALKK